MLKIEYHKSFKKDYKRVKKQGYSIAKLETVIALLADEQHREKADRCRRDQREDRRTPAGA